MAKTDQDQPVIIVGGGIGGLAAALALARTGRRVQVLEQAPEFAEIGAGIQIGPNALKMFQRLGIHDQVLTRAVFPQSLMMRDSVTGEQVTAIPVEEAFRQRFGYPYALIHRADLLDKFLDACRASSAIELRTGCKVVALDQDGQGVRATTEGGETIAGVALLGADGLWSMVRQKIVGDGPPRVSGHIAYRAVLPTTEVPEPLRRNAMVLWAGDKRHLAQYPLRGGELVNLVAVFHSARFTEGWNDYGDPEELRERFAGACAEVRGLVGKIPSWRMWVLCDRDPIKEWSQGRMTLLGDAAHPTLQYLAQGACMAIEDAVCIADMVESHDGDFAAAFQAYQASRYLRTAQVQLTARLYGEVFHATGVVRELRNKVLGSRTAAQSYKSMAWLYDI